MNRTDGKEKFTLLKGCEGFGDRLQCLLQAIEYSEKTGRTLVVDWEDDDWCHEEGKGFDHYFSIDGIKSISLDKFKSIASDNQAMTTYPKGWKN